MPKNKGQVTLEAIEKFVSLCRIIASERTNPEDFLHALNNSNFKKEFHRLLDRLAKERKQMLLFSGLKPWRTITLGTYRSTKELVDYIWEHHCIKSEDKHQLKVFNEIEIIVVPTVINLYVTSVAELGFPSGARWPEIRARLAKYGFGNCPEETGLVLRKHYTDQPYHEDMAVVMEPIELSVPGYAFNEHNIIGLWNTEGYKPSLRLFEEESRHSMDGDVKLVCCKLSELKKLGLKHT